MRVLFVSANAVNTGSAYEHRLDRLAGALASRGVETAKLHLDLRSRVLGSGGLGHLSAAWSRVPWDDWDWFHVGGAIVPGMLSLQRRRGARIIFDAHGLVHAEKALDPARPWHHRLRVPILWAAAVLSARRAHLCVTMSQGMRKRLIAWRGSARGVGLVRNGVDADEFSPGPPRLDPAAPFHVAYAGGTQPWQAVDLFVDVAARLGRRDDLRFSLIGLRAEDAPLRERCARRAPHVDLVDRMDRARLIETLHGCDLLVLPRRDHPATRVALPTKFAEYLALARPVLVNDVDETRDFVQQERCGFVAPPEVEAMAAAVLRAASTPRTELVAMGLRGRAFVERELCWPVIGERYRALLRESA